jgi:DNA-binding LacI/PurR family transcriptional regulator
MPPTMETIARRLNISKVTVSNAMRGSGRVSEETRARVLKLAEELGYRPNPLVTALMTDLRKKRSGRRCTLAFLNFYPGREDWREHPTFVQFYQGAQSRAEELGYKVELHWLGEVGGNDKRMGDILYARGIPGIVLAPLPANALKIDLDFTRFATVAIGHTLDKLVELGVRRIGLVIPREDDERVENAWVSGFIAAQLQHGLPAIEPWSEPEFTAQSVVDWIRKKKIQVVVGTNIRPITWMEKAGLRVPRDVGFVHLDWSVEKGVLAGIDQCSREIGAAAVDLLIEQLNNNETGIPKRPKTVLIDGCWHDGPSVLSVAPSGGGRTAR